MKTKMQEFRENLAFVGLLILAFGFAGLTGISSTLPNHSYLIFSAIGLIASIVAIIAFVSFI
jgi:hypothetical protein